MTTAETSPRTGGAGEGPTAAGLSRSWQRTVVWWDVAFAVVLVLTAFSLLIERDATGQPVGVALTALAVLAAGYVLLGRRAARTRERRLAIAYLLVLVAGTTVAVAQTTVGTFLLFAAFSQIWMLSDDLRQGIGFTVALTVGVTLALASGSGLSATTLAEVAPQMGVVLVFSVGLGVWVAHTMRQTARLAGTLDELHATRAALADAHRAEGVAAERERMAQEIHDTLAQGFTSIVMLSQTAQADLRRAELERAAERLDLVERTARENLAEARALVAAFAPVALEGADLAQALRRLGARFTEETGVPVRVDLCVGAGSLTREQEVILLRAAQEALANVRRHAGAHAVTLTLRSQDGIELEVVDDGRGMDPAAAEGFGLRGMRERVTAGGGTVSTGAGVRGGTRVRVQLPLPAPTASGSSPEPRQPGPCGAAS